MRTRRRAIALIASAAIALAGAVTLATTGLAATNREFTPPARRRRW